ncbi:HTH-type transcriptional regulator GbpR [Burkholderiales bacterium 8X]|nr:HTH-type transcriptional regulator GbpR [Burkholderiales bacterium 8X]
MTAYSHWFVRARLKTRQLLLLVALAEEGNIHRAAHVLNMAQPAASKLLKDLEDVLGVSLFDRLPRGMRPTWYGETMIRHARIALATLQEAHDEVAAIQAGRFGQVNIGAITSPGLALLPTAVAEVKRERPNLRVSVEIETSPVLLQRLEQGELDVLLARLSADRDKSNLRYEPLTEERVCAVVRPGHALAQAEGITLQQLSGFGWIVPPTGSVLRHRFDLMYQESGLASPVDVIESSALLFITAMLAQSDRVAVLAAEVGQYYASHGMVAVLPVEMPCHMDSFGLVTRTDRVLSPGAAVMVEALKAACGSVYGLQRLG